MRDLGATEIVERASMATAGKPLQSERWAGVVDTVGSHTLANACAATRWNGAVAACGLAQGADLPATVLPFILRGVTLYGVNCVYTPNPKRAQAWALLAQHLSVATLAKMTHEIGLTAPIAASADWLGKMPTGCISGCRKTLKSILERSPTSMRDVLAQ